MLEWLKKLKGISVSNFQNTEKLELLSLRKEIKKHQNKNVQEDNEMIIKTEEDDEEEEQDKVENLIIQKKQEIVKKKQRSSVSAEVYGEFNKKTSFCAKNY